MDEDEEIEDCEPCEDDYFIEGSEVSQGGKYLGKFPDYTDLERFIREHMEREQFWPNVWQVSDHGNVSLYTMDSKG